VVDQLVPGDADQPAGGRAGAVVAAHGVDGGEERLAGQVLGERGPAAPLQQVAVDLWESAVVAGEQLGTAIGRDVREVPLRAGYVHTLIVVRGTHTPTPVSDDPERRQDADRP
jgi:hypothetical protein